MKTINKFFSIAAVIWITITTVVSNLYNFNIRESVLLVVSGPGILVLLNPLIKLLTRFLNKRTQKEQKRIDKFKAIAKKSGKKDFALGKKKQHTIWAKNHLEAQKLYNALIMPLQLKYPNKSFYYISKHCNNLK